MSDLISRQAAIDAVIKITYDQTALHHGWVDPYYVVNRLEYLPTAEPSATLMKVKAGADKESLKKAMKAMNEAEVTLLPAEIIHCKECLHYDEDIGRCDLGGEWAPDDYCSYGRRPKHG